MTDPLAEVARLTAERQRQAEQFGEIETAWRRAIIEATHTHSDVEVAGAAHITRGRVYQIRMGTR